MFDTLAADLSGRLPERILCFALLGFLALVIPGIILQKEGGR